MTAARRSSAERGEARGVFRVSGNGESTRDVASVTRVVISVAPVIPRDYSMILAHLSARNRL